MREYQIGDRINVNSTNPFHNQVRGKIATIRSFSTLGSRPYAIIDWDDLSLNEVTSSLFIDDLMLASSREPTTETLIKRINLGITSLKILLDKDMDKATPLLEELTKLKESINE